MKQQVAPLTRLLLVFGAIFFYAVPASGQYDFNQPCRDAYRCVLTLRFDDARAHLALAKSGNPANLIPVYLENYIDFLTLFIGEQRIKYEQLKKNRDIRIKMLEKGDMNSPYYGFCLAQVNLQWAIVRLKFGDYTTAALEIRKAYQLFRENALKFPSFLPDNTGFGVVHIMAGIVPDKYKWISSLMGIEGSMEQGMNEIRKVADYHGPDSVLNLLKPEAAFYLGAVSANLLKEKKDALPIAGKIASENPEMADGPLLTYARATILMKNGFNEEAFHLLEKRAKPVNAYPFLFLEYLEGMARINRLDFSSEKNFKRYIADFQGLNYVRAACQKLAWIGLLRGDTSDYFTWMGNIPRVGASLVDEDKQAFSEAERRMIPNVVLLRSRLLSDGGYFDRALKELLDTPLKKYVRSRKDLVEYTYRLARIYHESGNPAKALDFYRQTIERGKAEPYYFATAAAYQMGLIFEQSERYRLSEEAYRQCLSIEPEEYKTSLHQKAKAGLARLKKIRY